MITNAWLSRALVGVVAAVMSASLPALCPAEARPGAAVVVTTAASGSAATPWSAPVIRGKLAEFDDLSITVLTPRNERVRIARDQIVRLEMRKRGGGRGRRALIGAGIGAAAGLGVAAVAYSRCAGEFLCGVEFALPILTAPAGALIGLVLPGREEWVPTTAPTVSIKPTRSGVRVTCSVRF